VTRDHTTVTPWHGRQFVPTSDGVVVSGDEDQRRASSAGAAVAPWQLGGGGPPCFYTVASSHYVDIYDGAKSKSVWKVRNTVSVKNAHDIALRTKCDFLRVTIVRSVPEC
jgi:hypothetical protein